MYIPFIEKSIELLNASGICVFICPTRFIQRDYGASLRQYVLDKTSIGDILDFSDWQVFLGAMNYTGIFSFAKSKKPNNTFRYKKFKSNVSLTTNEFSHLLTTDTSSENCDIVFVKQEELPLSAWYFSEKELMKKIRSGSQNLIELCDGIYQGVATGKDSVFVIGKSVINEYQIERTLLQPFLKGKDISPYEIRWNNNFLIYPYSSSGTVIPENELKRSSPNLYQYLVKKKKELSGRDYFDNSSKRWYELWNQRNLERFHQLKIVTLDNASKNSFALDEQNFIGTTTVYSIILKNKNRTNYLFTLGLLNSGLLDFFHKRNTVPQAGGFFRYQAGMISTLPIKVATPGEQAAIASKVEQILAAKAHDPAADVSTLEREIDELVADLYGLDDAEKQLVGLPPRADGSTPSPAPAAAPASGTSSFNSPSAARAAAEGDTQRAASRPDQPAKPPKTVPPVAAVRDRSTPAPDISAWDESALLCVARSTLARSGELARDDAIRQIATELGFNRTGPRIRETLESTLRVAVRRRILQSTPGGSLTLATRSIDDYTRDDLIAALRAASGRAWIEREDAIKLASRYLGFARTGKQIQAAFKSAINGAIRRGLLEYEGTQIRRR